MVMASSGCVSFVWAVRRKLVAVLVLIALQGLLFSYARLQWPTAAGHDKCHGSECVPAPTVTIDHPVSSQLRELESPPLAAAALSGSQSSQTAEEAAAGAARVAAEAEAVAAEAAKEAARVAAEAKEAAAEAARVKWMELQPKDWDELANAMYDYIEKPHAHCEKAVRVGGQPNYTYKKFDGYKWLCLDAEYGILKTNSCLIYSFGVDHDWSFDDNVQHLQCEIHAFDPSIGQRDHKRSSHISFHNLGIGARDETVTSRSGGRAQRWEMRTYQSIVSMLGHQKRTVHYLKVDVEGAEWDMFPQIFSESPQLLSNVRQIGMEIHLAYGSEKNADLERWKQYLAVFQKLEARGFRLFKSEMNPYASIETLFPSPVKRRGSRVYELVWLYQP